MEATGQRPTRDELLYLAGFLDGEGCFETRRLSVSNTYLPALERLQRAFGGTIRDLHNKPRRDTERHCYQWYLGGQGYRDAIRDLLPYLHEKRAQAAMAACWLAAGKEERAALGEAMSLLKRQPLQYEETL